MSEQDEMVTVIREARAIAAIRGFLENVQWQGQTGFNLREKEMEQGATDALSALLVLNDSLHTAPSEAESLRLAIGVLRRSTPDWPALMDADSVEAQRRRLTENALLTAWGAEHVTDLNAWAHTLLRALDEVQPATTTGGIAAAAEQAAREWIADRSELMLPSWDEATRNAALERSAIRWAEIRLMAPTADAARLFVEAVNRLLTAPAPLGEEKA